MFLGKKGTKLKVLIKDIKEMNKAKNAVIFDNSLEIKLKTGEILFLTSFLTRDNAYRLILNQMKRIRNAEAARMADSFEYSLS